MTREEAIKILKSKMDGSVDTSYEWAEAVRMAIEALQNLSKLNNGLQGSDLISRQDAIKNAHFPVIDDASYEVVRVDDILALPSADRPTGEWIEHEWAEEYDGLLISNYECTNCHSWERNNTDFCPNCGSYNGG